MREKIWTFIGRHAGGMQWRILWATQPKFIIGVSGLVRDEHGQVLLIKGRMWKPSRPWGLVTGYAKGGETWEQTIVREAFEETGYKVKTRPEPVALVTGFKGQASSQPCSGPAHTLPSKAAVDRCRQGLDEPPVKRPYRLR